MKYFAMVDTECVKYLGECLHFSDADAVAPGNTHWLFNEEALRAFVTNAKEALKESER